MTQPPVHHNAPPGLRAWLDSVDASREPSVREVTIDGVRCVIKRRRPSLGGGSVICAALHARPVPGSGLQAVPGRISRPGVVLRNGLEHEAERLSALLQAGCRVPEVWWRERGLLVLEYVGEDLADLIRNEDSTTRLWLARAAAADLAAFHARGLWHGGAQIRNITLREGELWRIDFEENIGSALSRPLTQAYDLFQMLASITSLRTLPDDVGRSLGKLALDVYFEHHPDAEVKMPEAAGARVARHRRAAAPAAGPAAVARRAGLFASRISCSLYF